MTISWDILISSLIHRQDGLVQVLNEISRQLLPGIGVRVYRDNLESNVADKYQALLESSQADYVSGVDDDDMIAPDYVRRIYEALQTGPDYVGFKVRYSHDGVRQQPVVHSLDCGGWRDSPDLLERDFTLVNPIRRELALTVPVVGGFTQDREWATAMRTSGHVRTQEFIDGELYYYQCATGPQWTEDGRRDMVPLSAYPPCPVFGFVDWLNLPGAPTYA